MVLEGIDVTSDSRIFVDGVKVGGSVTCVGGSFDPTCTTDLVQVDLDDPNLASGLHLLQIQGRQSPLSNEMPVCATPVGSCF